MGDGGQDITNNSVQNTEFISEAYNWNIRTWHPMKNATHKLSKHLRSGWLGLLREEKGAFSILGIP